MTAVETSEYAEVSAEAMQRGIDFVQDKIGKAEDFVTAENVQRGIDFVQDKIGRAEEFASSEPVQRGVDFVQDKIEQAEGLVLVIDDLAVASGVDIVETRCRSRRGLIIGGAVVIGVIVTVVIIRRLRKPTPIEEVEQTTDDPT